MAEVVTTEADCIDATSQLEMQYKHTSSGDNRPAGCYFSGLYVYFNTEINPALTAPPSHKGGVCIRQGNVILFGSSILDTFFVLMYLYNYSCVLCYFLLIYGR